MIDSDCTAFSCGHHNNPNFDPKNSTVFGCKDNFLGSFCKKCDYNTGKCKFQRVDFCLDQVYAEGSGLYGSLMMDTVMFGNKTDNLDKGENSNHSIETPLNMLIGCTNTETGLFSTQLANGIMGLYSKATSKLD